MDGPIQPTFSDLFCGVGGLSLGFQSAGFVCVQAIDHDEAAAATYRANFSHPMRVEEITEKTTLVSTDVILGGPPCQGFSSAGLRRENDRRNTLVRVFSEQVAQQRPSAFVFENVEGFLTASAGDRVFDLLEPLIEAGYQIHLRKINAANYGIPQHRKRVIAVGGLGWVPTFPDATHTAYGAPGAMTPVRHLPFCPPIASALDSLPEPGTIPPGNPSGHWTRQLSEIDLQRIQKLRPGQSMKDLPEHLWHESYRRRAYRRVRDGTPTERRGGAPFGLRRLRGDQPSKTITSGAMTEFVHPADDRFLTLRECARIQTFPDDFTFHGSGGQIATQIGNAVPPRLGEIFARSLLADLQCHPMGRSVDQHGGLLSFLPTTGSGMSPALKAVCERIDVSFISATKDALSMEQLFLWR
ncbi:MAG: DNA cytosine methyltransferase [Caldilineaceae bacterium]|nr:DNA cytosine methyltransferase [Caldilineaceae bacterium]HRJ40668.1 DNA cytosine methyltransferase [Caldilineaceae bacterium]